jgi:putative heme iron utilization protein
MGEHSLTRALGSLLQARRTAALGTLDEQGNPFVSMVPFAIDTTSLELVLHVSALASHTGNMQRSPRVSLLVCAPETSGEPVHALPRVTLDAVALAIAPGSAEAALARQAYLGRFPEAQPMTALGDFRFVRLQVLGARQVAGFGAARSLAPDEVRRALALAQA